MLLLHTVFLKAVSSMDYSYLELEMYYWKTERLNISITIFLNLNR